MSFTPPGYEESLLSGMDFSWVATDRDGHVAWLATFGSAVVPRWVDESAGDYTATEEWLEALPERGGCSTPDTSHPIEQWRAAARAGVFAYDWDVYSGPYQAIAVPALPVLVADLPAVFAALARRTRFAHLCFCERMTITVGDVELCALDHR